MAKAKEIEGLNCAGSATDAIHLVLTERLEEVCQFRDLALDWADPEGVHDMRVASRRVRSALRDFKPYLRGKRKLAAAARKLKRVADALGEVRDLDVAIMALEELERDAPPDVSAGIEHLTNDRRAERESARAALVRAIEAEKLIQLQSEFAAALEAATAPARKRRKNKRSAAELSFREAGREIILARLEELRELSGCLYRPFEVTELHDMRISAKRLRYAMELLASCWGATLIEHAKEVGKLQTSLGELHDNDVWLESFGQMLGDFRARETEADTQATSTSEQKRSAAIWLLRHFAKARMKHFSEALGRWHGWEKNDFLTEIISGLDERFTAVELSPAALTAGEAVASDVEARGRS